jgi:hypothetical protein
MTIKTFFMKKSFIPVACFLLIISFHVQAQLYTGDRLQQRITKYNNQSWISNIKKSRKLTAVKTKNIASLLQIADPAHTRLSLQHYSTDHSGLILFRCAILPAYTIGLKFPLPCYEKMLEDVNPVADNGNALDVAITNSTSLNLDLEYCDGLADITDDPADSNDNYDLDVSLSMSFTIRYITTLEGV